MRYSWINHIRPLPVISFFCLGMVFFSGCGHTPDEQQETEDTTIQPTQQMADTIDATGGNLEINLSETLKASVSIPQNAFSSAVQMELKKAENIPDIPASELSLQADTAVGLQMTGDAPSQDIAITLPVNLSEEQTFKCIIAYNSETGEWYVPFQLANDDATCITAFGKQTGIYAVIKINENNREQINAKVAAREPLDFKVGSGEDLQWNNFQIENPSTLLNVGGCCWGMSAYTSWYYKNHQETPLYEKYYGQKGLQEAIADDAQNLYTRSIKGCYIHILEIQGMLSEEGKTILSNGNNFPMNDMLTISLIKAHLLLEKRPAVLAMSNHDGYISMLSDALDSFLTGDDDFENKGHAVVVYECNDGLMKIYNPNYTYASDTISYDSPNGIKVYGDYIHFLFLPCGIVMDSSLKEIYERYCNLYASDQTVHLTKDTSKDIYLNGFDADGDALTFSIIKKPHGTLTRKSNTVYTFTPETDFTGSDRFIFQASDGTSTSNKAYVWINVSADTPTNTAPVVSDQLLSTTKNTTKTITLSGSDADSDSLIFSIVSNPSHGTLTRQSNTVYTYISITDYIGSDSFTYKANDGKCDSRIATGMITIEDRGRLEGKKRWEFDTGGCIYTCPAIGTDGTIYVGSNDGKLYAINSDGTKKWEYFVGSNNHSSPMIDSDGAIYIGFNCKLYALSSNGKKKWEFTAGNFIQSSPAVGSDGTIYFGSNDGNLYAVNSVGTKKWNFATGSDILSSPAIGTDGTIYVGSCDNKLYAVNSDGIKKWEFATESAIASSPAIGADGTIYIVSNDSNLYAINSDGTKRWKFSTVENYIDPKLSSPAIGADGTIYVGSRDGKLYAVNSDGTKKWEFATGSIMMSSPMIGADGTIYVGSNDGKLYAVNSDGAEKWEFATRYIMTSSPTIGVDGTIYVGSYGGELYAIYSDSAGLANSCWPKFHHDRNNSGRVGD
jgi:outer membrane protein assembly factor BamB